MKYFSPVRVRQCEVPTCFMLSSTGEPCQAWAVPHVHGTYVCTAHNRQMIRHGVLLAELVNASGAMDAKDFEVIVQRFFPSTYVRDIVAAFNGDEGAASAFLAEFRAVRDKLHRWLREGARAIGVSPAEPERIMERIKTSAIAGPETLAIAGPERVMERINALEI